MRPAPEPAAALRALRLGMAVPGRVASGRAAPDLPTRLPPARNRTVRVLAAGLLLSALGHSALALWLVRTPALPPPDGPDVPASEVSLLSGAQFAALTAPQPDAPEVVAPDLPAPPDSATQMAMPRQLAPAPSAPPPAAMPAPASERAPDVAALSAEPPDPQVAVLLPELTAPQPSPTGVPMPRRAADPVAQAAPKPPEAPAIADARPAVPEAAPAPPEPAAKPPAAAPKSAAAAVKQPAPQKKPASQAGDGGAGETTRAKSAGSAEARDSWLSSIRARVERRKAYPPAAGNAEGRVTLQLTVDRSGRLKAVGVARSSGNPTLDAAALRAVKSAGRFPKAPGAVTEAAVTFNLPLRFSAGS
jgi:periplasmic protein TonB